MVVNSQVSAGEACFDHDFDEAYRTLFLNEGRVRRRWWAVILQFPGLTPRCVTNGVQWRS